VLVGGKPLAEGSIQFVPTGDTQGPTAKGLIKYGSYSLPSTAGAVVGRNKVQIEGFRKTGKTYKAPNKVKPVPVEEQYLPATYNSRTTLEVDVRRGSNEFKFDVKP
jgi:hypothetical protein